MAYEVELKAHIEDIDSLRRKLTAHASSVIREEKRDLYFERENCPEQFRIRLEVYGDGEPRVLFTHKEKSGENGIEVNRESEFTAPGDQFSFACAFARAIGYHEFVRKEKIGYSMSVSLPSYPSIHVELVEVPPLGCFLEAECLTEDEVDVERARQGLLTLLSLLSIGKDKIEERPYMEMLLGEGKQDFPSR